MITYDEFIDTRLDNFIKRHKGNIRRQHVRMVIEYLVSCRDSENGGWVRARDMHAKFVGTGEIPYSTTLNRILSDLSKDQIIETKRCSKNLKEPGKRPVFYRAFNHYNPVIFLTREEHIDSYFHLNKLLNDYVTKYKVAVDLFKEHTKKDIGPFLKERIDAIEAEREEQKREHVSSDSDPDPCKSL